MGRQSCSEITRWRRLLYCGLLSASVFVSSCESRRQKALNLVADRGVIVTEEALFEAIEGKDVELVSALLELDVPISTRDDLERTPLMIAAVSGESASVTGLLERGADVEAMDTTGRTPISYAVEGNDSRTIAALLDFGANGCVEVDTGGMLVAQALRNGQVGAVELLLESGVDPHSKGALGESLVQLTVKGGYVETMRRLIAKGYKFEKEAHVGGDLLLVACENAHQEMLELLLQNGVDPGIRNDRGESLVHVAVNQGQRQYLSMLKRYGASLDAVDSEGWRPIHYAILVRDNESLQELLANGADPDLLSEGGDDPSPALRIAFENRLFSMAGLLLRFGADPGDEIYEAIRRGGVDGRHAVELLLEAGASPAPSRSPQRDSSFNLAVRQGEWEIAKLLLDAGAPVNGVGLSGQSPLHVAVARGDALMVGLLLDKGADPEAPLAYKPSDSFLNLIETKGIAKWALNYTKGMTPLMLAADTGNVEVAQQLIVHGANTAKSTVVRSNRMGPLAFATRRSDVPMMQAILGSKPGKEGIWVKVDLSEQLAYIFDGEKEIYRSMISSGKRGYRTRTGKFVITNKYRHWNSTIYGSSMPYFQRLSASDFGFHVGNCPGYAASHGCIRMPNSAAKMLFSLTKTGDYVEIQP